MLRNGGRTAEAVTRLFSRASYRIGLTATPIENGLLDLYNVFRWVDPKVFLSKEHFESRYVVFRRQYFNVKRKRQQDVIQMQRVVPAKYVHLNEVKAKLRPAFLRRTAAEVGVQLPEVVFTRELIELGPKQRAVYDLVRERTKKYLEEHPELEGEALEAPLTALRQAADSTELVPEGDSLARPASAKVDRLRELLDGEFRGEQVLIFTDYERFVRILMRELRAHKPVSFTGPMGETDRRQAIDMFVRGYRRVLIGTKALEKGHNLQTAGIVVNADMPWSPASIKQRLGRLRRLESRHATVRVRDLAAADTIEETMILPKLAGKHRLFEDVLGDDELSRRPAGALDGMTARRARELV